jgi:hypothetical protein
MATSGKLGGLRLHQQLRAPRRVARARSTSPLIELLISGLWIVFFIVASYGATPLEEYHIERWAWLAADSIALGMVLLHPEEILTQIRRNMVLMSWPALACVSTVWSLVPYSSLYQGIQLFLTVLVALCLVITADLRRILILLFLALFVTAIVSTLVELVRGSGGEWIGIFPHKNVLGSMMVVMIMTAASLLLSGGRPYLSAPGVLLGVAVLAMTQSGTAIVALVVIMALVPAFVVVRWGPIAITMLVLRL